MRKTLTPLRQSGDDQFADNSDEDAEEVDTSLSSLSIGGQPLCNLGFAGDIDLLVGSEKELQQLTEMLGNAAADYGLEISFDKIKILVNIVK